MMKSLECSICGGTMVALYELPDGATRYKCNNCGNTKDDDWNGN